MTIARDAASPGAEGTGRRRRRLATGAVVVIVAGLAVVGLGQGTVADLVGDALYAALVYLMIAFLTPEALRWRGVVVAVLFCATIEVLQLTGLPAALVEVWAPARYLLGTTFNAADLLAYGVGAVAAGGIDTALGGRSYIRPTPLTGASPGGEPVSGAPDR